MLKSINKYLNLSVVVSILFVILGIVLMVWPETSLNTISYVLATFLIIYGIYNFIDGFTINPIFYFMQMTNSILSVIFGIVLLVNPTFFEKLIPIVLGIFFIISGSFKVRMSFIIKGVTGNWFLSLITSIIMILCGIVLIMNPMITAIVVTSMIGIILVIYSIFDIIDTFIFKARVKDISKYFEKLLK